MIQWTVTQHEGFALAQFSYQGLLDHAALGAIELPAELEPRTDAGIVFSGKGPVWLYGHLVHLAHKFAWVATYEPRLCAGVVVQSHVPDGPAAGEVVPVDAIELPAVEAPPDRLQSGSRADADWVIAPPPRRERPPWHRAFFFLTLAIVALACVHWLAHAGWYALKGAALRISVTVTALLVFFAVAAWLYDHRFLRHRGMTSAGMIVAASLLLVSAHTVAFSTHDFVDYLAPPGWAAAILLGAVLVLALHGVHRLREGLTGVRSLRTHVICGKSLAYASARPAIKHLVLAVSAPNWRPGWPTGEADAPATFTIADKDIGLERRIASAIEQLEELQPRANWQHMLRAVRPHIDTLESVWLIGSNGSADDQTAEDLDELFPPGTCKVRPEDLGSHAFLGDAQRLLQPYLGQKAKVLTCRSSRPLDFENVEGLRDAVRAIVMEARAQFDAHDHEILVDATGGMKTTSVVGAVSTLNNESLFQYVATRAPHDVYLFDLRVDLPPEA